MFVYVGAPHRRNKEDRQSRKYGRHCKDNNRAYPNPTWSFYNSSGCLQKHTVYDEIYSTIKNSGDHGATYCKWCWDVYAAEPHGVHVLYKPFPDVDNQLTVVEHLPNTTWEQYTTLFQQREEKALISDSQFQRLLLRSPQLQEL